MNLTGSATGNSSAPEPGWSYNTQKELLELWLDGMDIELLARHLNRKHLEVIMKLSELILKAPQPLADSDLPAEVEFQN
jgi:hypothetical protein